MVFLSRVVFTVPGMGQRRCFIFTAGVPSRIVKEITTTSDSFAAAVFIALKIIQIFLKKQRIGRTPFYMTVHHEKRPNYKRTRGLQNSPPLPKQLYFFQSFFLISGGFFGQSAF